ncbi:phage integrase [Amaricoccus solimangrovi]|nr:DUF6538 domain-containing protein [Amaricoccus solimangrovi]
MGRKSGAGGVYARGGNWYFKQRVPRRFEALDPRRPVRISLKTDSEREAHAKAPVVAAELWAYWEALEAGNGADAKARHASAVKLAKARGFAYRPAEDLAAGDLVELVDRLKSLVGSGGVVATGPEAKAVLGMIAAPRPLVSELLADFFTLTTDRLKGKNEAQAKRWRGIREATIADLIGVLGDVPINEISREDVLRFRAWWQAKVEKGHAPNTANKQFGQLSDIFQTVNDLRHYGLENPFKGLRFKDAGHAKRDPYSAEFIRDAILRPGALDGMNTEARDILLAMINTGAGPNEIIGLAAEDYRLDHAIPHIRIRPNELRGLKTTHGLREREIPALGVSLQALRRLRDAGGCSRYVGKNDSWSTAVNAYMRENGLRENPRQTAYSLRHGFEDRLLDAGCDDRIRADLMGHKYARPKYGAGGRLARVAEEIGKIAL